MKILVIIILIFFLIKSFLNFLLTNSVDKKNNKKQFNKADRIDKIDIQDADFEEID